MKVLSVSMFSRAHLDGFSEEGGDAVGNAGIQNLLQLLHVALVSMTLT